MLTRSSKLLKININKSVFLKRSFANIPNINGVSNAVERPSFGDYRKKGSDEQSDKIYSYFLLTTSGAGIGLATKNIVYDILSMMAPSADVLAQASIEVDISALNPGNNLILKWRGKPVYIRHRTPEEISTAQADDTADLKHPEIDSARVKNPNYLVVLAVCSHLGCVPIVGSGDYNGYFCPCHGSHYDSSGRIRKGPAPLNLEVPPYIFIDEGKLLLGSE
eukprot:TRINITY_DN523_c1_g2_i1.p1 TRINITY_DN523_c1_g2~~TRINITY_DN523_c1_g2_i1.p1  ORF type:complete len:221 (-),score=109.76 TRINITY_DN523_c1_g2_i1:601-1263(-)